MRIAASGTLYSYRHCVHCIDADARPVLVDLDVCQKLMQIVSKVDLLPEILCALYNLATSGKHDDTQHQ